MASVFKRGRDKTKRRSVWYISYDDHQGKRRTRKGFTDKGLSEQLGAKLEHEAMLRKRGLIDAEGERRIELQKAPIEGHLKAFEESLTDNTPKHIRLTMTRIRRIVNDAEITNINGITVDKVAATLRKIRKDDDLGHRTYNHYVQAVDGFCNWLVTSGRADRNPLASLERLNAEVDVRHKRRALTEVEFAALVKAATYSKEKVQGYSGEQRVRLYLMSYMTGLRRKELASLTPRSFELSAEQPVLHVEAACSKHRKKDTLPLHPDLVALLPCWLVGMTPDEFLFPRLEQKKTWLMVKKDLERANIPYETAEGIADFHAAGRHTHVTELLRSGASLPEARQLARHSDVRLTMRYTHIGLDDQAKALAGLPVPHVANINAAKNWQRIGSGTGGVGCQTATSGGTEPNAKEESHNDENPRESEGYVTRCHSESSSGNNGQKWRRRESNPQECRSSTLENKPNCTCQEGLAADWQRKDRHSEIGSERDPQSMLDLTSVLAAWHQLPRATQQIIAALVRETTR